MVKQSALLRSESSSLLLEVIDGALVIAHWGALLVGDLADVATASQVSIANSSWDHVQNPGIMRESSRGFLGRPTLSGHRSGRAWSTKFEVTKFYHVDNECSITFHDAFAELEILINFDMDTFGVITQSATVSNRGDSDYTLDEYIHWLPLHKRQHRVWILLVGGQMSDNRRDVISESVHGHASRARAEAVITSLSPTSH